MTVPQLQKHCAQQQVEQESRTPNWGALLRGAAAQRFPWLQTAPCEAAISEMACRRSFARLSLRMQRRVRNCVEDRRSEPAGKRKACRNIDDCPTTNACGGGNETGTPRGLCEDLALDYTCTCTTGYTLVSVSGNLACSRERCGTLQEMFSSVCPRRGQEQTMTHQRGHSSMLAEHVE